METLRSPSPVGLLFIVVLCIWIRTTTAVGRDQLYYYCHYGQWRCYNGQCIDIDGRCDSVPDCYDASDENCDETQCNKNGLAACEQPDGSIKCVNSTIGCDANCGPVYCDQWEACDYSISPHPLCVGMNNCTGPDGEGCYHGLRCCGHGIESCVCESPKMINTMGLCKDCDCMWNERCTVPHGKCACGDYQVRDHYGNCVDCDPELSCPKCGHDRTCSINPGDKSSSCECLPGSVERDGECVWCKPCPRDCDRDHVCITQGFSDPYCGCPGGMDEIDGECVTCPRCPDCGPDRKCVVRDGHASCECPHSTYDTDWGCIPLNTCPPCRFDEYEVCVLPTNGSPHCECADGYVRDKYHKCVPCVQDECEAHADCTHTGEICYKGQCKCAAGWALYDGECIPDGYLGGSCKRGQCHGKRTSCSSHGQCECNDDCYKEPIWACIPKRKKSYW